MIECPNCHTLSSESESACLACGGPLIPLRAASMPEKARCAAGHPVDPTWKTCPYCDRAAQGAPRLDSPAALPLFSVPSPTPFGMAATTRLEEAPRWVQDRRTSLQEVIQADHGRPPVWPAVAPPPPIAPSGVAPVQMPAGNVGAGRLVAVLAAPEIGPGGSVFPIRSGKTILGADRRSQVPITGDPQVSNEHAILLYREGVFHLTDRLSTNGSWVNGVEVPANGTVILKDRDHLRLGNTHLVLLIVDAPQTSLSATVATIPF